MPDKIIEHGEQSELYAECGFDAKGIAKTALQLVGVKANLSAV
jgi:1-deoxy-D-xylulose-5-phosphate synthase